MQLTDSQLIHRAYLQSDLWRKKRQEALAFYGCVCMRCGDYGNDVHHKTYERVGGFELMEDFEIMCRDCHEAHHRAHRVTGRKKNPKGIHRRAIFPYLPASKRAMLCRDFGLTRPELLSALWYGNDEWLLTRALKILGCDYYYGSRKRMDPHPKKPFIHKKVTQHPYYYGVAFKE